ncbi:Hypothetical predicted protein [Mytilus galloprovincialis]|uniref:Uncharacterized protein n=1 Tax=Mytilus galloprovincialis TaxID=29158 RepID=A0A8B6CW51_MYTGA|nr:Hypothetical predicted protein [Mytilus galloprovincialis]
MFKPWFSLYLIYVVCQISIQQVPHEREKRKTGQQTSPGRCFGFNRRGMSRLHYYSCCNNCGSSEDSCNNRTYHTASSRSYCNECGKDGTGNGKRMEAFKCGGCRGQQRVYDECAKSIANHKGLCWVFTNCFEETCKK